MKRLLKWVFGLLVAVIVLLVLAAFLLPMLIDSEELKSRITEQVKAETGRTFAIDGDLGFSVFPNLAVDISDLRVGEAGNPDDQPSGAIGEARVSVSLMPLLKKQLVVNGLSLEGGDLEYLDQASGAHYAFRDLEVQTGPLQMGETGLSAPVEVDLSTTLEDLVAGTTTQLDLTSLATIDVRSEIYTLEDLSLKAQPDTAGAPIRLETPKLVANLADQTAVIESFIMKAGALEVAGKLQLRDLLGEPSFDAGIEAPAFSPRELMADLGMAPVETTDPAVLDRATLSARINGTPDRVVLDDLDLQLDDSRIEGKVTVSNFAAPVIRFDVDIDAIDLDRYLPPAAEPAPGEEAPVVIPAADLGAQDIEGTLRVGQLTMMGLDLSDAEVGLRARDGLTRVHPLTAGFFGGRYNGDIRLDSRGEVPRISFDEKVESVLFRQMAADLFDYQDLTGTAQGQFKAEGAGFTADQVIDTMKGNLKLGLDEGALEGIDIWYEIRKALARIKGKPLPEGDQGRTVFSTLQLDASLAEGLLRTNELTGQLPFLNLDGKGSVDIRDLTIDLGLTATVRSVPELQADPLAADLQGKRIPLRISGELTNPGVAVDVENLLKEEATDRLFDKLGLGAESEEGEESEDDETKDAARRLLKGLRGDDDDG